MSEKFNCASHNSVTHDAMVFTNSILGLKQDVLTVDEKASTVDTPLKRRLVEGPDEQEVPQALPMRRGNCPGRMM
jgi:hypothetical protein